MSGRTFSPKAELCQLTSVDFLNAFTKIVERSLNLPQFSINSRKRREYFDKNMLCDLRSFNIGFEFRFPNLEKYFEVSFRPVPVWNAQSE